MNRFARLVELRKVREEAAAMAYGQIQAKLAGLHQQVQESDSLTTLGRDQVMENVTDFAQRLPPHLGEDFLKGQQWRRQRLLRTIRETDAELLQARALWVASKIACRQVEQLAEKEDHRRRHQAERREAMEMDQIGILRQGTAQS